MKEFYKSWCQDCGQMWGEYDPKKERHIVQIYRKCEEHK